MVGVFIIGALIPMRASNATAEVPADVATSVVDGGFDALGGLLLVNPLFMVAAVLRFFAHDRWSSKRGHGRVLIAVAATAEVLWMGLLLTCVWSATTPVLDAGMMWVVYALLVFLGAIVSLVMLVVALIVKPRRTDAPAATPDAPPAFFA
ncbi:hypothetical protein [Demequina litorisediminis]|uniref:Uncharacterized protein n=1 Tax=Demequina litorisediminis TaxID=1849022 RepID=A0ABQ6IBF5_9MICO|nr:hypothetical protein [Demequina litorisediminis]GMA34517.1 hypothetical protein GCM10025876_07210 [Demequina litorisediminis]